MIFQEHVLSAPDVCNNCYRRIRRERHRTTSGTNRSDVSAEKTPYTATEQTGVEHTPARTASDSKRVFCTCGTDSAYQRIWTDGEDRCLRKRRVKDLVKRALATLEAKGVTLRRQTFAATALDHYYREHDLDAALKAAAEAAVQTAAAASDGQGSNRELRADGGGRASRS